MLRRYIDTYNKFGKDQPPEKRGSYHIPCSEVMLKAIDAEYDLGVCDNAYHGMQTFGGGFYKEKTCGAFIGACMALGMMYGEDRPSEQESAKKAAKLLVEEFEKEFGSLDCDYIKEHHRDEVEACDPVKLRAGEVFERVLEKMNQ
jgi:C_GCAxxG_C_C family probable redox protein